MKIAIIGAGLAGLACAKELERLGEIAHVFERDSEVGWPWESITVKPALFFRNINNDVITYMREGFDINLSPTGKTTKFIMKSENVTMEVSGSILAHNFHRGREADTIEQQLKRALTRTPIFYSTPANFKELAEKYDYVVVASGKDTEAAELGVWKDEGQVSIYAGIAIGKFDPEVTSIFFNNEYAGSGYARISPVNDRKAIVGIYVIGHEPFELERMFSKFLKAEKLESLEFTYNIKPPVFQTGRVSKFTVGNILLTGRAAGLIEKVIGVGALWSIESGVLAARAMVNNLDYDELVKPIQKHVDNISSFRKAILGFSNEDYDRLLTILNLPAIKK